MQFYKKHRLLALSLLIASLCAGIGGIYYLQNSQKSYIPACRQASEPFSYTLCQVSATPLNVPVDSQSKQNNLKLRLVWQNPTTHTPIFDFTNLLKTLPNTHFAMNAGMYDEKFAPIGYTVIDGEQIKSLNLKNGGGNFHLMPNGVFWWDDQGFYIDESQAFSQKLRQNNITPRYATQSGPMLVINGNIHPDFDPKSDSKKIRNGVGICQDGTVKLLASDSWINFYEFADFFKTNLKCDNALFLDGGRATAVYSRELGRQDTKYMGVMVVAVDEAVKK